MLGTQINVHNADCRQFIRYNSSICRPQGSLTSCASIPGTLSLLAHQCFRCKHCTRVRISYSGVIKDKAYKLPIPACRTILECKVIRLYIVIYIITHVFHYPAINPGDRRYWFMANKYILYKVNLTGANSINNLRWFVSYLAAVTHSSCLDPSRIIDITSNFHSWLKIQHYADFSGVLILTIKLKLKIGFGCY